jgi:hypothetical protein
VLKMKEIETINLFSVPVFKFKVVPTAEQYNTLDEYLKNVFNSASDKAWASETGKSTGEYNLLLHTHPEIQWLINATSFYMMGAWNKINYAHGAELSCVTAWANLHGPGHTTGEHTHCNGATSSHLSAVYYFKKPQDSGHIEFRDPLEYIHSLSPRDMYVTDEYHSKIHTTVESNEFDLLIFPSWLNHRSQPNKSNENRIAISMNFIGNWKLK